MPLHIETIGHGPPLVLLHGWAMHSGVFAALTERLRKAHTVYLVDLPGHGYSRTSHLPLALEPVTQVLLETLPPAIWLGWSLGGLLALQAARSGRLQALIMLCASPCFVQQPDWPHGMPTGTFNQFATGLEHNYQQTLERFIALETLGSAHAREDRRRLQQLLFARGEPSRKALLAGLGVLNTADLRRALATLNLPSLWLSGQHDRLVHPGAMHAAAALAPHAHSITLERAGHAPMLTHADTLAAHILRFTSCVSPLALDRPMTFDPPHIRRAFSRAAHRYTAAAHLQHEVETRLLESLIYLDERVPDVVLDLGCGPGSAARAMHQRWPKARIVALDLSLDMLRQLPPPARSLFNRRTPISRICANASALPLADHSVDVLFSNLCLQWLDDLPSVLAGFRRVLKPGGLLLCSTFGPDTLWELREAFSSVDNTPHISPFASIATLGDALMHAGFRDPVLDRDLIIQRYPNLTALMHELRAIGATNALTARRRTLTARARFTAAATAYEPHRDGTGQLPASWEILTLMAWSPALGTPIRHGRAEIAHFPAHAILIRRSSMPLR